MERMIQLNIIEAVKTESDGGLKDNGYVGISVAAHMTGSGEKFSVDNDLSPRWRLGKDWIDSYTAWNMAFVTSNLPQRQGSAGKLLIPSILCTTDEVGEASVSDLWMASRVYSLFLSIVGSTTDHANGTAFSRVGASKTTAEFAAGFGKSNLVTLGVPAALREEIKLMENSFPSTLAPLAGISAGSWQMVGCLTLWGSAMIAGWGIEVVSAKTMLQVSGRSGFISGAMWTLAQLIFPFFLSISIYGARAGSVFSLPFLVAGLWKLGFPETISAFVTAHLEQLCGVELPIGYALSRFMNGLGLVFHHSATTWMMAVMISGVYSPGALTTFYMAVATPLVFQHWVVLTKKIAYPVYVVVEIGLEVWWEIEVLTSMHHFRYWHEQRCLWAMLVAHWLFLAGAVLDLAFKPTFEAKRDEGAVDTRGTRDVYTSAHKARRRNTVEMFTSSIGSIHSN
jgi:hypothetical protein